MVKLSDYESDFENKWCPGCGNFGILNAMKSGLVGLGIPPSRILIVSGIGQAAKTPHFLKCNGFHSLHGRALPIATGAKIANRELTVLVNSGDGDCYGEGGNHFMHAIRRNINITLLVHDNMTYGLTKGQASPTSRMGTVTKMQPRGVIHDPMNPLTVALALGAGFVARGFSGEVENLALLIQQAIEYRGFSLIDILQPCVSFNKINTFSWYKDRVDTLSESDHDPKNLDQAFRLARQWGDKIPIGVLFRQEKRTFNERLENTEKRSLFSEPYSAEKLRTLLEKH